MLKGERVERLDRWREERGPVNCFVSIYNCLIPETIFTLV